MITWAIVCVENKENSKRVSGVSYDLSTQNWWTGLTIISDQHKGLFDACKEIAPYAQHRACARRIYATYKKNITGVQYRRLFWQVAFHSLEPDFERSIHLMDRSRAFQN